MCTAITYHSKDHYFGRTLDLDCSYEESVTVTPRNFPFPFRKAAPLTRHWAIIGMAYVAGGYPLYYDAVNEHGLAMAGLNFPGNAVYFPEAPGRDNITPFEFIPWILGQCRTVADARPLLDKLNLLDSPFSPQLPLSPLHWIIADTTESIVVESVAEGLRVYDDPMGVMANNPPFDFMRHYIANFQHLSPEPAENRFASDISMPIYCQGLAAMGLPGDFSSASRFVRAAFVAHNAVPRETEEESVGEFFHLLGAVEMPRGSVHLGNGVYDISIYTSCCNQERGIYYYVTYDNRQISCVDMHNEDLEADTLFPYPILKAPNILRQN